MHHMLIWQSSVYGRTLACVTYNSFPWAPFRSLIKAPVWSLIVNHINSSYLFMGDSLYSNNTQKNMKEYCGTMCLTVGLHHAVHRISAASLSRRRHHHVGDAAGRISPLVINHPSDRCRKCRLTKLIHQVKQLMLLPAIVPR